MIDELYTRQVRLRDVGPRGQQRIAESHVMLGTGEAPRIAAEYLRRSGVGSVQLADGSESREFIHAAHFTNDASRTFAQGCWLATNALTEILGPTPKLASGARLR